jgi:hypothetical protein
MSAKGFASRAVRDVIDMLAETDEEILFFSIHDADAYGTMIHQSLCEGTLARPARKARVINLGLEPAEAIEMGLPVEEFKPGKRRRPVADYVPRKWVDWLQSKRVELNAMNTPQFLAWLDGKMDQHSQGKVIPPSNVLHAKLESALQSELTNRLTADAIRAARVAERVGIAVASEKPRLDAMDGELTGSVRESLDREPEQIWADPIRRLASSIADQNYRTMSGLSPPAPPR